MRTSTFFAFLVLPFAVAVLAHPHAPNHARHDHDIARRASDVQLHKRVQGRVTYYDVEVGTTACGQPQKNTDFVAALSAQFGVGYPGPYCFMPITISCNGKTAVAKIVDKCSGCNLEDLDLSIGLFDYFANRSTGILTCDWTFVGS